MSSLADLPELVGFFSYSREDDADDRGELSALRDCIERELGTQLGRSKEKFGVWQDKEEIPYGTLWEERIKTAVGKSVFFIPIITPRVVKSPYCRFELDLFLAREAMLGRSDLVFPILYIRVPGLENSAQWQNDPVLSVIAKRQYRDWRKFRHHAIVSTDVRQAVADFCEHIADALNVPWLSLEERQEQEEAEARRRAEDERQRQEAEARRREEEARRKAAAEAQARERVEHERRRQDEEAERVAEAESRRKTAAEAERQRRERDAAAEREAEEGRKKQE